MQKIIFLIKYNSKSKQNQNINTITQFINKLALNKIAPVLIIQRYSSSSKQSYGAVLSNGFSLEIAGMISI